MTLCSQFTKATQICNHVSGPPHASNFEMLRKYMVNVRIRFQKKKTKQILESYYGLQQRC